jgi:integrase
MYSPQEKGGICVMANWGKVIFNKQQKAWAVKGKWQGKWLYYSEYRTEIGYQTCQTEHEAKLLQMVISSDIANGTFNPNRYRKSKPLHIRKFAPYWLERHRNQISHSTYNGYRAGVKQIIKYLGDIFLPDLNYDHISDWVVNKMPHDLKTRKNYHGVLSRMLKDAMKAGHITQMPFMVEFKDGLSKPQKQPDWLEQDAFDSIIEQINPADRYIFKFLRITGVRQGEGRALRRSDLYPDREYIMIRNTFSAGQGREILRPVKQKRERRIPFYKALYDLFNEMPQSVTPFVFTYSKTGRPYTKNINKAVWNPASKKALGYVFPLNNAGRHSFANQLLQVGVDPGLVSNLLGHSDKRVLFRSYGDRWEVTSSAKKVVDNVREI